MDDDVRDFKEVENPYAFLGAFPADYLLKRGVLRRNGAYLLLRGTSVDPLLHLMREHAVTRLESAGQSWWLKDNGDFHNPKSDEQLRTGNVGDLRKPGNVFNLQNEFNNPYFKKEYREGHEPPDSSGDFSEESKFGLERDLQRALRSDMQQLEPGLTAIDGGTERTVGAGRIDITAEGNDGSLVVIELKAGRADYESVAQLLSYMGSIENPQDKPIRGILVANDFHPRTVMAAKAVPNISLKAYSFQFTFEDR